jgi:hypothetical protein
LPKAFKVQVEIAVPDPNFTRSASAGRPVATANKPLGVQFFGLQILSSANNVVIPVGDFNDPPRWQNDPNGQDFDLTPHNLGFLWVNLNPLGDSDLDVDDAGFVNTTLSTGATIASMQPSQYGAAGGPYPGPMPVIRGDYIAMATGLTDLHTLVSSGVAGSRVFKDATLPARAPYYSRSSRLLSPMRQFRSR